MSLRRLFAIFALMLVPAAALAGPGWNRTVTLTADGAHVLGNSAAAIRLTEFVSYTCPHCAHFEVEADAPLRMGFVAPGKVAVEVRHLIRDPIDLTVAQLANCGPKEKFFANHAAFMRSQQRWMTPLMNSSPAQRTRWQTGDALTRQRAIAADFGLYDIMQARGYSRPELDRCLADQTLAKRIASQGAEAQRLGVEGTPSFAINGVLLAGTHSWEALEPQLRLKL